MKETTKRKISKTNKGRKRTEDFRRRRSECMKNENHPNWREDVTRDILKDLYLNQKLSMNKIANILNMSISGIKGRMIKYNIPKRDLSEYKNEMHSGWDNKISIDSIIKLYIDNNLSMRKVGDILNVDPKTIARRLEKYNIPIREKKYYFEKERHWNWQNGIGKEPYPFEFNEILKEKIRERDNYICQLCGKKQEDFNQKLCIHHINYIKIDLEESNLITLCLSCNSKVNYNRIFWTGFLIYCIYIRKYSRIID